MQRCNAFGSATLYIGSTLGCQNAAFPLYRQLVGETFEDGNENKFFAPLSTRFFTRFSRQSTIGWNYSTFLSYAGRDFNPEMGFQIRDDFFRYGARVSYGFFPANSATIFQHGPSMTQSVYQSNSNHKIESYFSRYGYQVVTKSGSQRT